MKKLGGSNMQTRKTIMEQQKAWGQLKKRVPSRDQANELVNKYYMKHADKLVVKGS